MRSRASVLTLSSTLVLGCVLPRALLAQGKVEGTVVNGTADRPAPGLEVRLLLPRGGMQQVGTATTDSNGHFAFDDSQIDPKSFYLLSAEYKGVPYNEPAQFDSSGRASLNLTVYDATHSDADLKIGACRVLVAAEGPRARVQEQYAIENNTRPARAYRSADGTFRLQVPARAGTPSVAALGLMNMQLPQTPEPGKSPGEFFIRYPIKPGTTILTVQYEMDYASSGIELAPKLPYPADRVELYVFPPGLTVASPLFTPAGMDTVNNVQRFEAANLPRGTTLEVQLSGESAPVPSSDSGRGQGEVQVVPDSINQLRLPVAGCLLLLLLWALGVRVAKEWPRWKARAPNSPVQKKFEATVGQLLNSMADLDELFAAGKVADRNYWKERLELKAKLVTILKRGRPAIFESYAARHIPR